MTNWGLYWLLTDRWFTYGRHLKLEVVQTCSVRYQEDLLCGLLIRKGQLLSAGSRGTDKVTEQSLPYSELWRTVLMTRGSSCFTIWEKNLTWLLEDVQLEAYSGLSCSRLFILFIWREKRDTTALFPWCCPWCSQMLLGSNPGSHAWYWSRSSAAELCTGYGRFPVV